MTVATSLMAICYQEQDVSILLLLTNGHETDSSGHKNCIKCTNANVRLRTPDDGQKGCPKHVES